nr:MAG: RNA-dependent RNA polymerase [Porcine picobirnavirus]
MPKNCEIKFEDCFNLPNQGLRSYFDMVRKGQPDEYRTPFAKGKDVQEVLNEWKPFVDKLSGKWPTLVDFENDLAKKVGPMSIMKPLNERMEDIEAYYDGVKGHHQPISRRAIDAVISEWGKSRGLQVRRQSRTLDLMKKSTNSGSPYFTKRKNVLAKTAFCNILGRNSQYVQYLGAPKFQYLSDPGRFSSSWECAAVLGWRGQEGGPDADDVKQRVVWMFPFAVNVCELQVYQPLIESAQHFNTVPAWVSMEAVDHEITLLFDTKGEDDLVVCTDFSKFDQHFGKPMQDAAKSILTAILTPGRTSSWWLDWIFPIKYDIPLAYDYGKVRCGKHGMGSGSGGTNADETLAHRALQYEAAQESNSRLNPHSMCLGDDGILTYPGITVDDVTRSYSRHGLEMNPDKQSASAHECTYLRRWHHRDYRMDGVCVGVYSTYRALGRLMEQERYYDPEVWGPKMVALRQLSIIENVKYHPLRDQFAEFCMARDKYRLGIDIPGFLDNIEIEAKKAIEYMPDFLGYTKSMQTSEGVHTGISEWWIVRYLKSK